MALPSTVAGAAAGIEASYRLRGDYSHSDDRLSSQVKIVLDFLKPFKSSSTTTFDLQPEGEATRVTWTMTGAKTLMIRVMGLFRSMDKMIGPDFEKGLARLKTVTEQRKA